MDLDLLLDLIIKAQRSSMHSGAEKKSWVMAQMDGDPALAATIDWVLMILQDPAVIQAAWLSRRRNKWKRSSVFLMENRYCVQKFTEPVTLRVDINLLYTWVSCTRASRFYLHVGDAVFASDSVSPHLNHIEKIAIVAASDFKVLLRKDAKADKNDTIQIQQFGFNKLTVL